MLKEKSNFRDFRDEFLIFPKSIDEVLSLINLLSLNKNLADKKVIKVLSRLGNILNKKVSKQDLLSLYYQLKKEQIINLTSQQEANFLSNIQTKKTRTISGVTTVTVLTKPFPCPGKCIFCPNDYTMPKSYLQSEPGAQRAAANQFDPYFQTYNRLVAIKNNGHPTDKIELIVLGGTWSCYPEEYQIWFIKKCFEALNDFGKQQETHIEQIKNDSQDTPNLYKRYLQELEKIKYKKNKEKQSLNEENYNFVVNSALIQVEENSEKNCCNELYEYENNKFTYEEKADWNELIKVHKLNEISKCRCVGLSIETRPDEISQEELIKIRKLGVTKIQLGVQSLNDKVLTLNKRGHSSNQARNAINLLRRYGFKIQAHWMQNLYGSSPKEDIKDFKKLFRDLSLKPDELKIYPCSLIPNTELMTYYQEGKWLPYNENELKTVLKESLMNTPRYCRITRMIRDISGDDIAAGNKTTNLRQIIEQELKQENVKLQEMRYREVKDQIIDTQKLKLKITRYQTSVSREYFLEFCTPKDDIAGFLRLSLPKNMSHESMSHKNSNHLNKSSKEIINESITLKELEGSALIREVHVYGSSVELGVRDKGKVQHIGLGKKLIAKAEELAKKSRYSKISVISSIGTRQYYEKLGYSIADGKKFLYQNKSLKII